MQLVKTEIVYVIQGNNGYGWEDETQESTWKEAKEQLRCYRSNVTYPIRYVRRRVDRVTGEPYRRPKKVS